MKNKAGGLVPPDINTYYVAIIIQNCNVDTELNKLTEQKRESRNRTTYSHLVYILNYKRRMTAFTMLLVN